MAFTPVARVCCSRAGLRSRKATVSSSGFSEDIDITVFREDIDQPATVEELEALSRKKREARLDAVKTACQVYINGQLLEQLQALLQQALEASNIPPNSAVLRADPEDADGQSLLLWYPTVTADGDAYIRRAIKIESGAKNLHLIHTLSW
jgi:hypothetical protein